MTPLFAVLVLAGISQQPLPLPLPLPLPQGQVQPLPAPTPLPQAPATFSLADFSRVFAPLAGNHQVWFVHPATKCPVEVNFTLPPGRMKRFEVADRWIEFRFDKCDVRIEFRKNGSVKVDYRD